MDVTPPRRGISWHMVWALGLTLVLLAWFLRGLKFAELGHAIAQAHPLWVGLTVAAVGVTYTIRGWRWQALLAPIGGASFRNAFRITVIGFTATNLLPGRLGEIVRPYLLARVEPVAAPAAFATVVIERVLDLGCVMLLFGVFLLSTTIDVGHDVRWAGLAASVAAAAALGAMVFGAAHPHVLRRWAARATKGLPSRVAVPAERASHTLVDGLAALRSPRHLLAAAALSLGLWLSIGAGIWCASRALDLTMPFPASFLVVMYLVVGVAVPVPAGVGSFHFMYQLAATQFLGATLPQASAAAIVLHAVTVLPISVLGLIYMTQDGWTLARLRQVDQEPAVGDGSARGTA